MKKIVELAACVSPMAEAPAWFMNALAKPGKSCFTDVNGTRVHYLAWGHDSVDKPALVFAHGFRAHARWWDFIAPFFADEYRVFALDFSGMGDSGHRDLYDRECFVRDILGVLKSAAIEQAILIGHSFGGGQVWNTCHHAPELISRAIIIDSHLARAGESMPVAREPSPRAPVYPDLASAMERFRLIPQQAVAEPYLLEYIARHSLKPCGEGWTWKFDRAMPISVATPADPELLRRIKVPIDYIYGEFSAIVDDARARWIAGVLGSRRPILIPDGYHHVLLTQPLALVSTLRALLSSEPGLAIYRNNTVAEAATRHKE